MEVTVNYHMALHLPDMILDLGPPHAFWCFAYERMNGILAGSPNSNRSIEMEVANRFVQDVSFRSADLPFIEMSTVPNLIKEFVTTNTDEDHHFHAYPRTQLVSYMETNT